MWSKSDLYCICLDYSIHPDNGMIWSTTTWRKDSVHLLEQITSLRAVKEHVSHLVNRIINIPSEHESILVLHCPSALRWWFRHASIEDKRTHYSVHPLLIDLINDCATQRRVSLNANARPGCDWTKTPFQHLDNIFMLLTSSSRRRQGPSRFVLYLFVDHDSVHRSLGEEWNIFTARQAESFIPS